MSVSLPWCVPVYGSVVSKKGCDYMRSVRFLALTISIYSSVFVFFHAHVNRALCTTCSSSRLHASIALCPQSRRCGAMRCVLCCAIPAESGKYSVAGAVHGSGTGRMAMAGGIVEEADNVLGELVKLRKWKEDMENT